MSKKDRAVDIPLLKITGLRLVEPFIGLRQGAYKYQQDAK
jgi:hypothetical protein